ncbi:MAG: hypothetical protein ACLPVY_00240 [Acidimicrobiia bacterium]
MLALLFLTVCGVTIGGMLTFATAGSTATTALRVSRGNEYDADAAMQAAIATIRVGTSCTTNAYTPSWTLNNPSRPLRVDCFVLSTSSTQRNDALSVCPTSVSPPCPDNQALLRANVIFYDTPTVGASIEIQSESNQ